MSTAQGKVEKIYTKDTAQGTRYSICLEGGVWYGFNKVKPEGFNEGDTISFEFDTNGRYNNAKPATVSVVSQGAAPAANSNNYRRGGGKSDDVQKSIVMQSSQKVAAELLAIVVENDGLQLGSATGPKATAKRLDAILAAHADITQRVYNRNSNPQGFLDSLGDQEEVDEAVEANPAADESGSVLY